MKLKKIASLMLAGIMAVSMLAGCKSGSKEENSGASSSEPTTVSGAAAGINAELNWNKDVISFENDADLDADLKAYFALHPIAADTWKDQYLVVYNNNGLDKDLKSVVGANWVGSGDFNAVIASNDVKYDGDKCMLVAAFNTKTFSQAEALKYVGKTIDQLSFAEDTTNTNDHKVFSYSGTASVIEVESDKGAESIWVVTVVIAKDYVAA